MTLRRILAFAALGCWPLAAQAVPAHSTRAHGQAGRHPKPAVVIRLQIVSGTPQVAHAYVAPAAPIYVTEFTQPLVVRVSGAKNPKQGVRFFCVTKGCTLPPQEQPDGTRIDPRTFEVPTKNGKASISVTIATATPQTVEVYAQAVAGPGERAVRSGPFRLTEQ